MIFNEHFISHLTLEEAEGFLAECFRVLKPGGVLRTTVPGLPFLARLAQSSDTRYRDYVRWATDRFLHINYYSACLVVNNFFYGFGYKFIYDPATLTWMLSRAGFSPVVSAKVGESTNPELRGLEGHGKYIPNEFNELETFVSEATKPKSPLFGFEAARVCTRAVGDLELGFPRRSRSLDPSLAHFNHTTAGHEESLIEAEIPLEPVGYLRRWHKDVVRLHRPSCGGTESCQPFGASRRQCYSDNTPSSQVTQGKKKRDLFQAENQATAGEQDAMDFAENLAGSTCVIECS